MRPEDAYPHQPGWRRHDTSRDAALDVRPRAEALRIRVLRELRRAPGSSEDLAARLGRDVHAVRPRVSELFAKAAVADSGRRGRSALGHPVIVWKAVER